MMNVGGSNQGEDRDPPRRQKEKEKLNMDVVFSVASGGGKFYCAACAVTLNLTIEETKGLKPRKVLDMKSHVKDVHGNLGWTFKCERCGNIFPSNQAHGNHKHYDI